MHHGKRDLEHQSLNFRGGEEMGQAVSGPQIYMVRGGIGKIRLAGKELAGHATYFLGASSAGITHQGIPIALTSDDYRKVMPVIKEYGGCRVDVIGRLQSISDNMPVLQYDVGIPRYCLFAEEVVIRDDYKPVDLLTTVAVMFTSDDFRDRDDLCKSWTFCSFPPGSSPREAQEAAEWLWDYAQRYSGPEGIILTDFDEHARPFPCAAESSTAEMVRGLADGTT